jgi:hypothetical protein
MPRVPSGLRGHQRVAGAATTTARKRIDPGVVSVVAELRAHERQAVEKLSRWKTHHEERKPLDASPAELEELETISPAGSTSCSLLKAYYACRVIRAHSIVCAGADSRAVGQGTARPWR